MFPFKDDNPTRRLPIITILFILLNVAVYATEWGLPASARPALVRAFGVVPARFGPGGWSWSLTTLITSQFLHGSLLHLGGNMLYLWIFGNNVEDALGRALFVPFYLLCGVVAGCCQIAIHPHSGVPIIGASGAIAGLLGAYFVLFPRARIHTLVFLLILIRVIRLPAGIWLAIWFLLQIVLGLANLHGQSGIAFFAHVGGFAFGAAVMLLSIPRPRLAASFEGFGSRSWLGR